MEAADESVSRDNAQINGQTNGPKGSDNTNPDAREKDNLHKPEEENSANGLDSEDVRGGQDGRNIRGMGSTDMDSENGVLRLGDQDNSTMEVTDKGLASATAGEGTTNTATVSVTTAGPDDYASDPEVGVPSAQEEAKKAAGETDDANQETADTDQTRANTEDEDEDIAETGTSINHQPTY